MLALSDRIASPRLARSWRQCPCLITLFVACVCVVCPAWAQPDDPPSIVAWLGQTQGAVSFAPSGTDTWAYASPNRPLTTGDQLWVDRGGRAELHVGSTALRMGPQSNVAITSLSDNNMQWRLSQGSVQVRIRTLYPDQRVEIDTPNLAFVPSSPGSYRIDVDPGAGTTRVTNWSGGGTVYGNTGTSEVLPEPDRVTYSGTALDRLDESQDPSLDEWDRWAQARDDEESRSTTARYVSREMTGYAALDGNGTWTSDPAYGPVWIPAAVASDWAPYHDGHWAWIEPWGWTWVDDAPWGFAPFHYGRWAWLPARSHWGWVPGPVAVARPVYAPALVAFVAGGGGGTRWGVALSNGAPGVAWLPLAPGEVYRPGYRVSPRYVTRINQTIVVRNKTVNNNVYVNQQAPHAVAAVPSQAFVRGQHVRGTEGRVPADVLRHARFVQTAAITPAAQSRLGEVRPAPAHVAVNQAVVQARSHAVNRLNGNWPAKAFQPEQLPPPAAGPAVQPDARHHDVPRPPSAGAPEGRPTAASPPAQPRPVPHPPSAPPAVNMARQHEAHEFRQAEPPRALPVPQQQEERRPPPPHPPQLRHEEPARQRERAEPPSPRGEPPAPPPQWRPAPAPPQPHQPPPPQAVPQQSAQPHPEHARPEHRPRKEDGPAH
jgi:hypothetical protein